MLSINIHASKKNINFFDKEIFRLLKNIILINTSRGEVINEKDLLMFLQKIKKSNTMEM